MSTPPPIIISATDAGRLEQILERAEPQFHDVAEALEGELARAEIRAQAEVPADVVTMNSQVLCVEEDSHAEHELRLVYPHEAGAQKGNVSILAPVGAALLGLSVGQTIEWPLPGGRTTRLRVVSVLHQPDAAEHRH